MQDLGLPTSIERLCLYNVLREGSHHELRLLTNLVYLKVGTQALADGFMEGLPQLPSSLLKPLGWWYDQSRPTDSTDQAEDVGDAIAAHYPAVVYHQATARAMSCRQARGSIPLDS